MCSRVLGTQRVRIYEFDDGKVVGGQTCVVSEQEPSNSCDESEHDHIQRPYTFRRNWKSQVFHNFLHSILHQEDVGALYVKLVRDSQKFLCVKILLNHHSAVAKREGAYWLFLLMSSRLLHRLWSEHYAFN